MSDVTTKDARKKFKVGQKVKGRVLHITPHKVFLTLKKSLVDSDLEKFTNWKDIKAGTNAPPVPRPVIRVLLTFS